jgi:hypothetical protein
MAGRMRAAIRTSTANLKLRAMDRAGAEMVVAATVGVAATAAVEIVGAVVVATAWVEEVVLAVADAPGAKDYTSMSEAIRRTAHSCDGDGYH